MILRLILVLKNAETVTLNILKIIYANLAGHVILAESMPKIAKVVKILYF